MRNQKRLRTTAFLSIIFVGQFAVLSANAAADVAAQVDRSFANRQPSYPDLAQLSGEQGTVMIDVLVRPSGKPVRARVSQSSGFEDLDTNAIQGVLNWHYLPARRDGDLVSDWTTVKVVFRLPDRLPGPSPTPESIQSAKH
ncbi:MAG TPA: energy transducer TonB [Rhizomicrobium sp.]